MRFGNMSIPQWFAIAASFLVLVVNVYNSFTLSSTRVAKTESLEYAKAINQGVTVRKLNNQLINALAKVSAETNDGEIKKILQSEGVTFTINRGETDNN